MELAIYRKRNNKTVTIIMAVIFGLCLIPVSIVLASALSSSTMGMTGVNNSQLTVGMNAIDNSTRLMDNSSHPTILNPSSGAGQMAVVTVLIFLAFAILLVLYEVETQRPPLVILLTIGVLIYMALALLPAINTMVTTLLGG
jgi:hypothetical protein